MTPGLLLLIEKMWLRYGPHRICSEPKQGVAGYALLWFTAYAMRPIAQPHLFNQKQKARGHSPGLFDL